MVLALQVKSSFNSYGLVVINTCLESGILFCGSVATYEGFAL